jgi:citrate synthase
VILGDSLYLNADEAAHQLGISHATLYAYVSRGLIRSETAGDSHRTRRYRTEDIERLRERKESRRNPAHIAASALHWGEPVLDSAITLIADGHLYYRGRDAVKLARQSTVEQVAALLWTGDPDIEGAPIFDSASAEFSPRARRVIHSLDDLTPVEKFHVLLPLEAVDDIAAYDFSPEAVIHSGARILRLMAILAAGSASAGGVARTIQAGWCPADDAAAHLISAAMILCADHELNVASFTARCVASAGSTPYAVVLSGLSALQGTRHGGHSERVEAFLRETGSPDGARKTISARLKRGERIPGFGHRMYPDGDPRARALLEWSAEAYPNSPAVELAEAVAAEVYGITGQRPALDFGLAALSLTLALPPGGAVGLFGMGRTIGWIGHALEQYQIDRMIRPRARYTGEAPT